MGREVQSGELTTYTALPANHNEVSVEDSTFHDFLTTYRLHPPALSAPHGFDRPAGDRAVSLLCALLLAALFDEEWVPAGSERARNQQIERGGAWWDGPMLRDEIWFTVLVLRLTIH